MPDALVAIDDNGLPPKHGQHVAFRANRRAGCATDAIFLVNMRMLGLRPVRTQASLLLGLLGGEIPALLGLEVPADEKQRNNKGDENTNNVIHSYIFSQLQIKITTAMEPLC